MLVRSLALGVAAVALLSSAANAADLIIPTSPEPIYEAAGFDWEGLYAGARIGGVFADDAVGDTASGFALGGVVGVNFLPADAFLLGVEATADYVWSDDFADHSQWFANVRAGALVTDSVLVYALAGVGVANGEFAGIDDTQGMYQLGGGVELAVTDSVTVRGEIVGQGYFDDAVSDDFFDAAKATVGVFYHF